MIKIDIEKVSTNKIYAGIHWNKRKEYKDIFCLQVKRVCKDIPRLSYPVNLTFQFYFKGRLLDTSNCSFMVKMIEDGLVVNNILPDDCVKYVGDIIIKAPMKGTHDYCELSIQETKGVVNET